MVVEGSKKKQREGEREGGRERRKAKGKEGRGRDSPQSHDE